jgi:primosomal protein N' (replication factor Y)
VRLQHHHSAATRRVGPVLRVAIDTPLYTGFDYYAPKGLDAREIPVGARLRVPFGRREVTGLVIGHAQESALPPERLRAALRVLDAEPLLDEDLLGLLRWTADYYHHPLGEVILSALPTLLRQGRPARPAPARRYELSAEGIGADPETLRRRAPRQAEALERLRKAGGALDAAALRGDTALRRALHALCDAGLATESEAPAALASASTRPQAPRLNAAQGEAVEAVRTQLGAYAPFLLQGVTGSGKTEVYLRLIEAVVAEGRQALVLVPEIGLTPQLVTRFRQRLAAPLAVLHSGLGERERLDAWLAARAGSAAVVVGTRSALFTPLPRLGLVVVDEEHDLSLKQQDGLRYNARDLALVRARRAQVPVVLGSATPSLESLYNAGRGQYGHLHLRERAGAARPPRVSLVDLRGQTLHGGLSRALLGAVEQHLAQDGQALVFLNRRGYAPTLLCHDCGWVARCARCAAHLTYHATAGRLRCHHCGAEHPPPAQCPDCDGTELLRLGQGTERLEAALAQQFPNERVLRIDRDTTRRRGAIERRLEEARSGSHRLLVGTQMLAKGHDFPRLTLVGLVDVDQGLFSADFRAPERMAQLIVQVAGRAGRAERQGEVLIQTHHPQHPLLATLIRDGYSAFAEAALAEREAACLPPHAHLALLRAEAPKAEAAAAFLQAARGLLGAQSEGIELLGPAPAPMALRAGRHRAQLLLVATERAALHQALARTLRALGTLREARRVRWSLDVDPQEMF